jgi:hypothetical protein
MEHQRGSHLRGRLMHLVDTSLRRFAIALFRPSLHPFCSLVLSPPRLFRPVAPSTSSDQLALVFCPLTHISCFPSQGTTALYVHIGSHLGALLYRYLVLLFAYGL